MTQMEYLVMVRSSLNLMLYVPMLVDVFVRVICSIFAIPLVELFLSSRYCLGHY